ncbi:MAG: type III pantothenate kinase [Cyanobium sp.]
MPPVLQELPTRWLLVGNSRWHWAEATASGLQITHTPPPAEPMPPIPAAPLRAWAAVGPLPADWAADPLRRMQSRMVPLRGVPTWLGVDRALAGWMGWHLTGEPVLVADAGTVLSLTRIDACGRFCGGRLIAGLGLQLRAMAGGTATLPPPEPLPARLEAEPWPQATREAMHSGVIHALVAALAAAHREALQEEPRCRLVFSGGDAPPLLPLLQEALPAAAARRLQWEPDLALRGLVALRPAC